MVRPTSWSPERDAELVKLIDGGKTFKDASELLGMSQSSLYHRYARIVGPVPNDKRGTQWTPDKIEVVRQFVAQNKSDRVIGEHFGVTRYAIEGLRVRIGLDRGPKHRIMPADFRDVAPTMNRSQLVAHYGAHPDTITRWGKATGVAIVSATRPRKAQTPRPANYSAKVSAPVANILPRAFIAQREGGLIGDAVLQLQRAGLAVYRLRVVQASAPMNMWVVGTRRMHEDEMIALASQRYGLAA